MTRTTREQSPLRADVYFDVLCPWSFIAKRRLERALSALPDAGRVEIVWRSFELSPQSRKTPGPTAAEEMTEWWGDRTAARIDLIRRLGAAEGLELNLHKARPVDTFDAHRLFHLATAHGRSDHMLEHLLTAYHTDGLNVADPQVLEHLGTRAGLDIDDVNALLSGDAFADEVRADEKNAAKRGVTGVPSLVLGTRPPVSAVQPPEELSHRLERAITDPPEVPATPH
ncbi:DsbA family oxidoreductase [Actinomadura livida]|uniref:Protein disulfide isomerase FrnE n=1 Tax=Actinomadura livida TaxID=79909 RepID=A0A7W7IJA7_9ACTN|nr:MULTISPECIES: DsbA family oxidoreductase [Actinomadura]MBB4778152.1 putative DsbA family dithiol-disulfide isomerase [Actinomadura catellatispora]GGU29156.1 DSBA oxidoreductase [Actinomadura livida]